MVVNTCTAKEPGIKLLCTKCSGGKRTPDMCKTCQGVGTVIWVNSAPQRSKEEEAEPCPQCDGSGQSCSGCLGFGLCPCDECGLWQAVWITDEA